MRHFHSERGKPGQELPLSWRALLRPQHYPHLFEQELTEEEREIGIFLSVPSVFSCSSS